MRLLLINIFILSGLLLRAQQDIPSVLASIEANNTTLKASRETVEARKLANRTGIYLSNPEVGFNYLWGHPSTIGNLTEFNVTQTFDIPTLSGMRSSVADEQNELAEWQYKGERMNILLEAKQYCIELIYYNALREELDLRRQHAEVIAAGYEQRLTAGDASRLEYNKARLNLSTVDGEIFRVEVERTALLEELKRLNGGNDISLDIAAFEPVLLPPEFDDWYLLAEGKSPVLAYIRQEVELGKKEVSLSKAMGLPTFSAGYASEQIAGERHQGFSLGISIPLWENKNRVKQARAAVKAAKSREIDSKQQFYSELQLLYNRTAGLRTVADNYRQSLEVANNTQLLKKALDAGEISLLEYMLEMGLYYDTVNQALEAERDYQQAYAELSAVEL